MGDLPLSMSSFLVISTSMSSASTSPSLPSFLPAYVEKSMSVLIQFSSLNLKPTEETAATNTETQQKPKFSYRKYHTNQFKS